MTNVIISEVLDDFVAAPGKNVKIQTSGSGTKATKATFKGGDGPGVSDAGDDVELFGGEGATSGSGGDAHVRGGHAGDSGNGSGGAAIIEGGIAHGTGAGGYVDISGGTGGEAGGTGGGVEMHGGNAPGGSAAGNVDIYAGGTTSTGGGAARVRIRGGYDWDADGWGSEIVLFSALGDGASTGIGLVLAGGMQLVVVNLPIVDPGIPNAIWNDSGTLKISSGL
ncbi:MAG: hypothetical protein U1E62_05405 [Alsobacter sp.]